MPRIKEAKRFGNRMELRTANVVVTSDLKQHVDLYRISAIKFGRFDKAVYHCGYLKTPEMHSRVSIFGTGKMISVGCTSLVDAQSDLSRTMPYLSDSGIVNPVNLKTKLQNIVLTGSFGKQLEFKRFLREVPNALYEPEQFPGIIHYPPSYSKVSFLLFASGKFVVSGIREMKSMTKIKAYLEYLGTKFT